MAFYRGFRQFGLENRIEWGDNRKMARVEGKETKREEIDYGNKP
jgi:hypothetical protein